MILIVGLIACPTMLFAQFNNNTSSPYSRYGLGDLQSYSFGRTTAMGGAALASRYSTQINAANPASYTALDSLNFLFEFGMQGRFSNYKSAVSSQNANDINFNYMAMSFRITNWMASSLGLQPYSTVGYNVRVNDNIENVGDYSIAYYGTGTISDAYLGLAIEPFKNVSLGMNLNYRFGSLQRNTELVFANAGFYNIQRRAESRLRDFGLDFGAQVTIPMKKDKQLVVAAVFENKPTYTNFSSDLIMKNIILSQNTGDQDTLFSRAETKGQLRFPNSLGAGLSFSKKDVYEINVDYTYQGWSDATFLGKNNSFLTDASSFAIGGEWIPEKYSIRSLLKRFAYRGGFKYAQSYHTINGHQINEFGITFGLGIPIYRSNSTINVGAEFGKRGTTNNGLVRENYAKLNLSVNLHDLWFMQRKID